MSKFSFGTPTPQAAVAPTPGGFSFGSNTSQPNLMGFGTPSTTSTAPLQFGTPQATATTGFTGFGSQPQTVSATPSLLGGVGGNVPKLGTVAPTLAFGATQPAATTSATPFLSLNTTTGTATGLGALAPLPALGQPAATTATAAPTGLGGVDINATQPKTVEGKTDGAKVKESQLPQEIVATVEALKQLIKQQKTTSSDIARTSQRRLNHVGTECQNLYFSLAELSHAIEANGVSIKGLRAETGQVIHHAELAQRTHETPAGLQFENTAPLLYFRDLVQKYENDLITFRAQVEATEKHMHSLTQPQPFTANDLNRGLEQIHESFIALAGRHHEVHQKVQRACEQYLNLRKFFLHDTRNVFEEEEEESERAGQLKKGKPVTMGPTPFSTLNTMGSLSATVSGMGQGLTQSSAGGGPQNWSSLAAGNNTGTNPGAGGGLFGTSSAFGGTSTMFGAPAAATSGSAFGTSGPFQLDKPPLLGNKRNKQTF